MDAHDFKKEGLEANHSIYNLNSDMLLAGGFDAGRKDFDDWDTSLDHMSDATKCLLAYIHGAAPTRNISKSSADKPAPTSAINFVRGGRTSYNNGGGKRPDSPATISLHRLGKELILGYICKYTITDAMKSEISRPLYEVHR